MKRKNLRVQINEISKLPFQNQKEEVPKIKMRWLRKHKPDEKNRRVQKIIKRNKSKSTKQKQRRLQKPKRKMEEKRRKKTEED